MIRVPHEWCYCSWKGFHEAETRGFNIDPSQALEGKKYPSTYTVNIVQRSSFLSKIVILQALPNDRMYVVTRAITVLIT